MKTGSPDAPTPLQVVGEFAWQNDEAICVSEPQAGFAVEYTLNAGFVESNVVHVSGMVVWNGEQSVQAVTWL